MVDANIVIEGYLGSYKKGVLKSIYRSFSSHYNIPGHTIAIIGWGEEKGDKYWIVRNAFGKYFGMEGDMWI
jgi:hypothetical protein